MSKRLTIALLGAFLCPGLSAQIIIARDANGAPYVRDGESSWISLDGELNGAPDACRADNDVVLVVRGMDNAVWMKVRGGNAWGDWTSLGGEITSDPAVACLPDGTSRVFARGTDLAIWTRSTSKNGTWESLGGKAEGAPDAAVSSNGRIDLVIRGADDVLMKKWWDGAKWVGWFSDRGKTTSDPAIARTGSGAIVVVTDAEGRAYAGHLPGSAGEVNVMAPTFTPDPIGGAFRGSLDAAPAGEGRLLLVGRRAADGTLVRNAFADGRWGEWVEVPGTVTSDATIVAPLPRSSRADCERTTDLTEWGLADPREPDGTRRWNDRVSCVETVAFPFRRSDLRPNEVVSTRQWRHAGALTGEQTWGFDLGTTMVLSQTPSADPLWDFEGENNRNAASYIYGKPVVAMSSGRVVRCWRNAPDNERPRVIHPMRQRFLVSGAGNFVVIEEDDGDRIWYAHAQPGSIPAELCPHESEFYALPNNETDLTLQDMQADVPPERQRRVNAGDYLLRVGNSGNSTAPHLHIHKQRGRGASPEPVALSFTGVRYQLVEPERLRPTLDEDFWFPLRDQPVPPGPVLLRPDP